MSNEWPVEPIKCFVCYDTGEVIDPFKQNERARCDCQTEPPQSELKILRRQAGQAGEMK